jgi:uncharacterized protein
MLRKESLKQVIESQRSWIGSIEPGIARETEFSLSPSFALVISGIRRCGKSTYLSQILKKQKNYYFLNLEDPRLTGFELGDFEKTDEIFKESYGKDGVYFFDEIQNVAGWEKYIRSLVDMKRKVVITGSNASLLSRELGTKLTGRYRRIELFPFSYREFLKFSKLEASISSYEKYLSSGGFPEFLKEKNEEDLHELLNDVIMRDIAVRFGIKNTQTLKKLAIYLVTNVGKEFSFNSLKNSFSIKSVQTVIDYASYLEDSYILFYVPKFSYSYKEQQVNPKKVYSIDNGFSYANSVSFSKDKGKMLENQVFLELRRNFKEIFYYQGLRECDFLVKDKDKVTLAIQVCYDFNEENESREMEGLKEAMDKFNLKEGIILTYNQEDNFNLEGKKINVIPVWKWIINR